MQSVKNSSIKNTCADFMEDTEDKQSRKRKEISQNLFTSEVSSLEDTQEIQQFKKLREASSDTSSTFSEQKNAKSATVIQNAFRKHQTLLDNKTPNKYGYIKNSYLAQKKSNDRTYYFDQSIDKPKVLRMPPNVTNGGSGKYFQVTGEDQQFIALTKKQVPETQKVILQANTTKAEANLQVQQKSATDEYVQTQAVPKEKTDKSEVDLQVQQKSASAECAENQVVQKEITEMAEIITPKPIVTISERIHSLKSFQARYQTEDNIFVTYNRGTSLNKVLKENKKYEFQLNAFKNALADIKKLHENLGLFHLDIKIDNMVITRNENSADKVYIIDFDSMMDKNGKLISDGAKGFRSQRLREAIHQKYNAPKQILNSSDEIDFTVYLQIADEYAFATTLLYVMKVYSPKQEDTGIEIDQQIEEWIDKHVKPEYKDNFTQLICDPVAYIKSSSLSKKIYLYDMINFE